MKAIGVIRSLDDLGRIVIPREIYKTLGVDISKRPYMEIYQLENDIVVEKAKDMTKGFIRRVDNLGRIVIPIGLERKLGLDRVERTDIEFFMDGEKIILRKYEPGCTFCGNSDNLKRYKGRNVCDCCIKELAK
jgi:AbrB family transcriptional regulator, transcriptional pleiotropic regulator of transition state genes